MITFADGAGPCPAPSGDDWFADCRAAPRLIVVHSCNRTIVDGVPVERTRATLRFWHPTAAPQAVTDALGLRPTDHHVVGEERSTRSPQATAWPASHWSLASRLPEQSCLGDHLKHLLSLLDGKGEAVRQLVHDGWEGDWFCFVDHDGQAGLELPSTLLRDLAEVPLSLTLDLYGDDG